MEKNKQTNETLENNTTTPQEAVDAIGLYKPSNPTSPKLVELQTAYMAAFADMAKLKEFDEQQTAMLATFKIKKEIDAEVLAIKTAERNAEIEQKRNERIALVDTLLIAHAAKLAVYADKKSTDEARNVADDAFVAARDIVANELLARYATSKPSVSVATGDKQAGQKGAIGAEIIELHTANLAAGMTPTESKSAIIAGGHSKGTTGAVVLAWEREQGLK